MDEQRIDYIINNKLVKFVMELRAEIEKEIFDEDYRAVDFDNVIVRVLLNYELKNH